MVVGAGDATAWGAGWGAGIDVPQMHDARRDPAANTQRREECLVVFRASWPNRER
jgi:hypothetical protein